MVYPLAGKERNQNEKQMWDRGERERDKKKKDKLKMEPELWEMIEQASFLSFDIQLA